MGAPAGYAYGCWYMPFGGYWPSGKPGHCPNQGSSMMGSAQAKGRPSALARVVREMRIQRKIASGRRRKIAVS